MSVSKLSILAPFTKKKFRWLFASLLTGYISEWLDLVSIMVLVTYHWELGATALATVTVAIAIPKVILGAFAGVLADRINSGAAMILSLTGRVTVMTAMYFFATEFPLLVILVLVKGVFSTLYLPSEQLALKTIVAEKHFVSASSLNHLVVQGAKIIGPMAGGGLLAFLSPHDVFGICALLSSAAIVLIGPIYSFLKYEKDREQKAMKPEDGVLSSITASLRFLVRKKTLLLALILASFTMLIIFLYDGFIALLVKNSGYGKMEVGLVFSAVGIGGVLGTALVGQWGNRFPMLWLIILGLIFCGPAIFFLGALEAGIFMIDPPLPISIYLLIWGCIGLLSSLILVPYSVLVIRTTPTRMLGRITAFSDMIQTGFLLTGPLIGAVIVNSFGVGNLFVIGGVSLSLIGFTGAVAYRFSGPNEDEG